MNIKDIKRLNELNNVFYHGNYASFDATRKGGWPGFKRVADDLLAYGDEVALLDVACGNLRFERYLSDALFATRFSFTCVDSCEQLAGDLTGVSFSRRDVIGMLLEGAALFEGEEAYDAAVTFGFMHHVPTASLRRRLLAEMVDSVKAGGLVACSLWRFAEDEVLRTRAQATTEEALRSVAVSLEEGDYLVGWDGRPGIYRYCHSFSKVDADDLVDAVSTTAKLTERFFSDGRNAQMNEYLVFRRI